LFGVFASRTGLGQLFIDLATVVAGRLVGGPAKVSTVSSGLFGMISGSSIANTVTTGAFTIPMMKKIGYRAQFAGAVEATASTGGQITPPIMGAAAFVMAEFLGEPYTKIALAAVFPALLHYIGVYVQVHLEAKRYGLRGLSRDELPELGPVLRERGYNLIPLVLLVYLLVAGFTPFTAAFWGIISAVLVDFLFGGGVPARARAQGTIVVGLTWLVLHFAAGMSAVAALFVGWAAALVADAVSGQRALPWRLLGAGTVVTGVLGALLVVALGFEPAPALFFGGIGAMAIGYVWPATRPQFSGIVNGLEWGARYALAVGAACACVGFILGTTTLTGVGFKFAVLTVDLAKGLAGVLTPLDVFQWGLFDGATLLITLVFVAIA
ncbi:MAG TPA: TRAP transporter fused permease subunit, partial [Methylomirabilota bacterium]|nr:TRAP transporter fused permease subunit [Methylomirabilota bacterium]